MDKKHVEPTPDHCENYEEAADFWDTHDTTAYLDEFRTVEANVELQARHFEVEIDETVAKALQVQAREKGVKISDLASALLRQQLGLTG
ncbi:MAG TPA: CopG family antitoxin [Abditibacteriaceae bacterium]|jgi:predicted phosphatase